MLEKSTFQKQPDLAGQKTKRSKKVILLSILLILALVAAGIGFYYYNENSKYFATENAKVTAKMYPITPNASGELLEWKVQKGEQVEKNAILGRQAVLPYITSPITGTIVENNGVEGQMVSPTKQLAVVADTHHLYIGVNVEETDIMKIQVGQTVDVKIDAYPGRTFKGVVTEIDRTTQTYFSNATSFSTSGTYTKVTQLIPVKVVLENEKDLPLTFGMNASVKIHLGAVSPEATTGSKEEENSSKSVLEDTSSLEAADRISVTPNGSGKVSKINVKVGQRVEKGDVLFELDSTDVALQVKQATANYTAALSSYNNNVNAYNSKASITPAQIAYDGAVANLNRVQALYDAGAASKVELDVAKDKVTTAQAQLQTVETSSKTSLDAARGQMENAKAALEIAQKRLDDCIVKAPMSGEVATRDISVGEVASTQKTAISLINAQNLNVHMNVTETHIAKVKVGATAEVKVQAIGAVSKGIVVSIAPTSDPKTGMFQVEILVNNTDGKLKPGMVTNVKLQVE
jgi:multidrug resistance efflux pump